jgi:hypothetical protein
MDDPQWTDPAPAPSAAEGDPVTVFDGDDQQEAFYAPKSIALHDGRFDLVIHFHGKHETAIGAIDESGLSAALVSVNLGVGSDVYQEAYAQPDSLDRVIAFAEDSLADSGRLPDARVGRVAISAFSAGYGAARELLNRPDDADRVDALLLVDGFFADWRSRRRRTVDTSMLTGAVSFARRAVAGEKLMVLTHTAFDRKSFAGAPACASALLRILEIDKGPPGPRSPLLRAAPTYAVDVGGLHVRGFDGRVWADHIQQHRAMGAIHYAALRKYWERADE